MAHHHPALCSDPLLWDVFCRVIDNWGDIGVCWRLCADLADRGHRVRLWVDDAAPLNTMAPGATQGAWPRVQVLSWEQSKQPQAGSALPGADVWVEAFGCDIATEFIAARGRLTPSGGQFDQQFPVWINLEYLSAEAYVERAHGLPSPILQGPAKGWTKTFFYPGLTPRTGGLLREPDLLHRQQTFLHDGQRTAWLARWGVAGTEERLVSLFCYEPAALPALLAQLDALPGASCLLVTAGRASAAVQEALRLRLAGTRQPFSNLRICFLPALTQVDYDHLLWSCDLNFVRGEDSLVRALWAGKPLVWQIYPQQDGAHIHKLEAFLDRINANPSLRVFHHGWNETSSPSTVPVLTLTDLDAWAQIAQAARKRLLKMDDLVTQLVSFVQKKR